MISAEAYLEIAAQAQRGALVFPTSVNGALRLQLALDDPDCPVDMVISLVLADPVLAARTVALANSASFLRGGKPATNARTAVLRIGYHNLSAMAAAMVVRQFGSRLNDPVLRARAARLWEHTAEVAALARIVARRITGANPDTAMFAGIVHEIGGFHLLSRAEEYPGLFDSEGRHWMAEGSDVVALAVMQKLCIPGVVCDAIAGLPDALLGMPPDGLSDTLLLANHLAGIASPLQAMPEQPVNQAESVLDFVIDNVMMASLAAECADEVAATTAALLV